MAPVAEGLEIVQHQSQIGSNSNRYPVVGVQVPLTPVQPRPQFVQHLLTRRVAQFESAAVRHNVRLPAAINTSPSVSLEAEKPKPTVVGVITALGWRASVPILLATG